MGILAKLFLQKDSEPDAILRRLGLTEHDLSRHFFFCGETGSGKTTVMRILLEAYLWLVCPGAVHSCVKVDEAEWICALVRSTPMRNRLMHLIPGQFTFNVAGFEMGREGGSPESLTRLLQRLNEQRNRSSGDDSEKGFWKNLFFDFMHFAATIAWLAHRRGATLEHIHQVIVSCPSVAGQEATAQFKQTECWKMMELADANVTNAAEERSLNRATEFFLKIQIALGAKARIAGVQQCSSILTPFLLSPFYETFCSPTSSFTPDMPLDQYYAIIDMPVLIFGPQAQLAQSLITSMTVEAALRQRSPKYHLIVVRDEVHMLAGDPLYETLAHSVARSHGLSFWSAVQNLPLLTSSFGGDAKAEMLMKSLLANYGTKFVLANSCMDVTNKFFSTMFGQHKEQFQNFSEQKQPPSDSSTLMDSVFGTKGFQFGASTSYADRIPPDKFLHLRRGGPPHFEVDAYMAGRVFPETLLPYKLVTFSQR